MCPTENWVRERKKERIVGKGISTIPLKKSRDQFEEELSAPSFVGSFLAPTPTHSHVVDGFTKSRMLTAYLLLWTSGNSFF